MRGLSEQSLGLTALDWDPNDHPHRNDGEDVKKLVVENNESGKDDDLIIAITYKESKFDIEMKDTSAHTTTVGWMGLTDSAVQELIDQKKYAGSVGRVDKTDPAKNIKLASLYLRLCIKRAKGDLLKALAGYGTGRHYATQMVATAEALKTNRKDPMGTLVKQIGQP